MFYIPQIVLFGAAERNVDLNYLKGGFFSPSPFICELGVCPALVQICSFDSSYLFFFFFFKEVAHCLVLPQVKKKKKGGAPQKTLSGGFIATIYLSGGLLNLIKSLLAP